MDVKELKEKLNEKREKISAELADAKNAAMQAKVWAEVAEQRAVNVLNHIRDLAEQSDRINKEFNSIFITSEKEE